MESVRLLPGQGVELVISIITRIPYGDIDELEIEKEAIRELRGRLADALSKINHEGVEQFTASTKELS